MEERLRQIMGKVFNVPSNRITAETKVETIENWDSLHHINLVLALEQEFQIIFAPEKIMEMVSFPKILEILQQNN